MSHSIPALTLGNIAVRQLDGLFCLNDLHRAAGGEKRLQPSDFLRMEWAQELIAEICSADSRIKAVETVRGRGKAQGTYACRELVISYAAWISAAFHLKVIRVFLNATDKPASPAPQALPHDKAGMMFVTVQERKHLEVLRWTTYAGRNAVHELARDVQKHHPWVDGDLAHNTARHAPGLGVQRLNF